MQTDDYRVRLDAFEGPLDLLLHLIRRAEVDITDIPISAIADQYIQHLSALDRIDIELAGEFLVMAATLMEIKSRMLAPAPTRPTEPDAPADPDAPPGAPDPRAELVGQLLAYKRFRDAADDLDRRRLQWQQRYPAASAAAGTANTSERIEDPAPTAEDLDLEDLNLLDLVEAFGKISASVNFDRLGEHQVADDDTPVELHAEDILDRLRRDAPGAPMPLRALFIGRTRPEMIGLFLATLELVRRRAIAVQQQPDTGEITLALRPDQDAAEPPLPS